MNVLSLIAPLFAAAPMPQHVAQKATSAHLVTEYLWLPAGIRVTLIWERSFRKTGDYAAVGPLHHEFRAFAYDSEGFYTMITVTGADLEAFGFD